MIVLLILWCLFGFAWGLEIITSSKEDIKKFKSVILTLIGGPIIWIGFLIYMIVILWEYIFNKPIKKFNKWMEMYGTFIIVYCFGSPYSVPLTFLVIIFTIYDRIFDPPITKFSNWLKN